MKSPKSPIITYLYALLVVLVALVIRIILLPVTGSDSPFILFSAAVLVSSFFWGVRTGALTAVVSTPLAGFLLIYQNHSSPSQAAAQMIVFAIEVSIICFLADRFAFAKRRAESSERAAKLALDERQIFFALLENSSDFIAISDRELKVMYINPAGRKMVGLHDLLPSKPIQLLDLTVPQQREFASKVIFPTVLKNESWHGKSILLEQKKGSEVAVSSSCFLIRKLESSEIIGIGVVARDISEITRAEEALRISLSELKEAQRVAKVGNWIWNVKTGQHIWSDELARIFGREPPQENFEYSDLLKLFTPESAKKLDQTMAKTLEDGSPYVLELELAQPSNGGHKWMSSRGEVIRSPSGEIIGIRGTAQDITELKDLQRLREEWNSVIAHDLRQPISLIAMSAELLPSLHSGEMDERERTVDKNIISAAMNLSRMVDDLLDISRMESSRLVLERKWVDPRILVRETVERVARAFSGVNISLDEDGALLPVYADQLRIEQVIGNLVSNAAKYGEKSSRVLVRLAQRHDELEISVTNEGKGIPESEIPTLFNRFWRSKTTRNAGVPGLGLGLYIAKGLIEAHGGKIWVKSIPGKTTTFYFTLPIRVTAEQTAA